MTEEQIGELWRKPENYMKPLAFGAALTAVVREECAVLCEQEAAHWHDVWAEPADACAARIRAP